MTTSAELVALQKIQMKRRMATGALAAILILAFALVGAWVNEPLLHESIEAFGLGAIVLCIVGRCWCALYIGGRKAKALVNTGPYSITRNPLYLFSTLGAWGFGAQTGSLLVGAALALAVGIIFRLTVEREEEYLLGLMGSPYRAYLERTPRFIPDFRLWRGEEFVEIRPRVVVSTFLDGLVFLSAIPLAEGLEALQKTGFAPVLISLP